MDLILFLALTISILSILFSQTTHPLALGVILIAECLLICLITSLTTMSPWFSYILFLIYMGALLVLFMYVATLASNEMFSFSWTYLSWMCLILMMLIPLLFIMDPFLSLSKISISSSAFSETSHFPKSTTLIAFIYLFPSANLTIYVVFYLLLTLVVVIQISYNYAGALRLT
uniref:NADH-ubiquinone oxidoreductase chain 6 n=1 Tax=Rhynchocinetes durbanensis TaxID=516932 RepID=A0A0X9SF73_9EUCA|nr:NADH dehydrogenase subunit 6 [Rhynchocinetes durbanensis]AMA20516.1 NADH dehydrogenase subunit 6 [Rhynchocinetes durbanensis]